MFFWKRVAARGNHGHNDGGQGAQLPGRRIAMRAQNDCGASKSLTISQVLQYSILASKIPQVRTWGAKVDSCPGRHLTSLRP